MTMSALGSLLFVFAASLLKEGLAMKTLALTVAILAVGSPTFAADVEDIRKAAIGQWEMDERVEYEGKKLRRVKDIQEKQEIVSSYDEDGKLVLQWQVDYEISVVEDVAVFTFWNARMTYPEKEEPAEWRRSYLFKIQNNKWHEVHNLFLSSGQVPEYNTYTRVKVVVVQSAPE